jgi:PhnB protein
VLNNEELIEEKFGSGNMSAIDFTMDIARVSAPKNDRSRSLRMESFSDIKRGSTIIRRYRRKRPRNQIKVWLTQPPRTASQSSRPTSLPCSEWRAAWVASGKGGRYADGMKTNAQTTTAARPTPEGYHSVTPYLMVIGADKLIEFTQGAFGAEELMRHSTPEGRVIHAEVQIGDSRIMLTEACGNWSPMPSMIYLYVGDADTTYRAALEAGATSLQEPADQFYGDRSAAVKDACGNHWWIATHKEDLSPEELQKRIEAVREK